jgi:hypothetical protein
MTENEAIKEFQQNIDMPFGSNISREASELAIQALEEVQQYQKIGTPEELQDMKNNYFEALSDWRQYHKIGTLEECRTAIEKQIPKKPDFTEDKEFALCPCCNGKGLFDKQKYCDNCGQKIDWSEESEE